MITRYDLDDLELLFVLLLVEIVNHFLHLSCLLASLLCQLQATEFFAYTSS